MSPWNAAGPPLCSPYLSHSHALKLPCLVYFVVYVVYAVVYCIRLYVYSTPPTHLPSLAAAVSPACQLTSPLFFPFPYLAICLSLQAMRLTLALVSDALLGERQL